MPTVRPGCLPISRTASRTPGMNEARSYESWRRVRVSPAAPMSTSWWATRPVSRTACTGTPSTSAPRAPGSSSVVASGDGGRPAARRAAATRRAVRTAVPDGASTLLGWCSSTTSTDGKNRAASCANFMSRTAPMPKLGAMTTPTSGLGRSHSATVASLASSKPVVPTTQWMLLSMQNRMLSMTTWGRVKSTTTCAPALAMSKSQSPSSTMATSSRSSAALTAFTTSVPIRPRAPRTPTLMSGASPVGDGADCWSGVEVLVVTRSGFPARGRDARRDPASARKSPPPGDDLPEGETEEEADDVGQPVRHRRRAVQQGQPLQHLAHGGVDDQQAGEDAPADPRPAPGERQGGEEEGMDDLVDPGGSGGHVRGRGEQDGQRDEDDDGEGAPGEGAVDLQRWPHQTIRAGPGRTRGTGPPRPDRCPGRTAGLPRPGPVPRRRRRAGPAPRAPAGTPRRRARSCRVGSSGSRCPRGRVPARP